MPPSELEILGQPGLDLQPAIDWYRRGGVAGSLGIQPVDQALAAAGSQPLTIGSGRDIMPAIMSGMDSPMLGFGVGSIEGWHGTPHVFAPEPGAPLGRFKNEAIGTGEGAQAYGYGHYVAGNKGVAKDYQRKLTDEPGILSYKGTDVFEHPDVSDENPHIQTAVNELHVTEGNTDKAINNINRHLNTIQDMPSMEGEKEHLLQARQWISDNKSDICYKPNGSLLEVHILPDEHELLDWDKFLSEQPDIQKKLHDAGFINMKSEFPEVLQRAMQGTGEDTYEYISQKLKRTFKNWEDIDPNYKGAAEAASTALHEAGIPGIKYLDAGSRRAGEGTRNYVIFHPDNLRIIGRNGQRLEPVDHDPFGSTP